MRIKQLNIRSIFKKAELREIIYRKDIDIMCIQETWLKNKNFEFSKQHKVFLKNRTDGYGGVGIIIRNRIQVQEITFPSTNEMEIIDITTKMEGVTNNIVNMYINPRAITTNVTTDLEAVTRTLHNREYFIVSGDVEAAHPSWDDGCSHTNARADAIENFITDSNFITLNEGKPTHLSYNKSQTINIIAVSLNIFDRLEWQVTNESAEKSQSF